MDACRSHSSFSFPHLTQFPLLYVGVLSVFLFPTIHAEETTTLKLGSLTPHYSRTASDKFDHKTSLGKQIILNPLYAIRHTEYLNDYYLAQEFFFGEDSIGSPIAGIGFAKGVYNKVGELGLVGGTYVSNTKTWDRAQVETLGVPVGSHKLVPVMGVEANLNLFRIGELQIKLNNLITPVLSNHTIGVSWAF